MKSARLLTNDNVPLYHAYSCNRSLADSNTNGFFAGFELRGIYTALKCAKCA